MSICPTLVDESGSDGYLNPAQSRFFYRSEVKNKMLKVIKSLAVIAGVGVLAFGVTRAVWSDSGTSAGNTFQAGTLNLKLSDSDETDQDDVVLTWSGSAMTPGGASVTATLNLKNVGNPAADHVHLQFANAIAPGADVGAAEIDLIPDHLQVTAMTYDGVSLLDGVTITDGTNGNGYIDLADLEELGMIGAANGTMASSPKSLDLTNLGTDHPLVMTVALNSDSPDENQGDSVDMTLTATLHQADGQ